MVPCVTTPNWHRFRDTTDGDDQCTHCEAVVAPEAHITFTYPCPVPDCANPKNPDRGCVFIPAKESACACVYCGRSGDRDHETDGDVLDDEDTESMFA